MIKLVKMNKEEFNDYMKKSINNYAKELAKSGVYKKEDCQKESENTFNSILSDGLNTKEQNLMNIVNDNNEKIGIIWYGPKGKPDSDEAFIYDFSIDEKYRGKGYGKKSIGLMEREAKNQNFNKISLHVFGHNKRAINLYKKTGFEPYSMHMSKEIK